jgi:hypothetical protein
LPVGNVILPVVDVTPTSTIVLSVRVIVQEVPKLFLIAITARGAAVALIRRNSLAVSLII